MKNKGLIISGLALLIIGALIYYFLFPETIFVNMIDKLLGFSYHIPLSLDSILLCGIRFYLLDFIWAFALMELVIFFFGCDKRIILVVFLFEALMELMELSPYINGTFDVWDIVVEILANIIVLLITYFFIIKKEREHEKV